MMNQTYKSYLHLFFLVYLLIILIQSLYFLMIIIEIVQNPILIISYQDLESFNFLIIDSIYQFNFAFAINKLICSVNL